MITGSDQNSDFSSSRSSYDQQTWSRIRPKMEVTWSVDLMQRALNRWVFVP